MSGVEAVYDQPRWHIEGLLGFDSRDTNLAGRPTQTEFTFGVRAWYHLHQGANSDFFGRRPASDSTTSRCRTTSARGPRPSSSRAPRRGSS